MLNYWSKKLSKTDLGQGRMHDKYLNIPKKAFFGTDKTPSEFYDTEPGRPGKENWVFIDHIDKKTGAVYKSRFEYARVSKQTRLYRLAECYNARKPETGDEIIVEKIVIDDEVKFIVDILRQGSSINVLSPSEINKTSPVKQYRTKPAEVNIFLDQINTVNRYASGKSRKSTDIIKNAELYKIKFTINGKTFVYVGQDSFCRGVNYYFGSSILTSFCSLVYGTQIFKKEILSTEYNITKKELDRKEWEYIYQARVECDQNNEWHNINREVQNFKDIF